MICLFTVQVFSTLRARGSSGRKILSTNRETSNVRVMQIAWLGSATEGNEWQDIMICSTIWSFSPWISLSSTSYHHPHLQTFIWKVQNSSVTCIVLLQEITDRVMSAQIKGLPTSVEGVTPHSSIDAIWNTYLSNNLVPYGMLLIYGEPPPSPQAPAFLQAKSQQAHSEVNLQDNAKGRLCVVHSCGGATCLVMWREHIVAFSGLGKKKQVQQRRELTWKIHILTILGKADGLAGWNKPVRNGFSICLENRNRMGTHQGHGVISQACPDQNG